MPRIVMLVEVPQEEIESFYGEFEKMVESEKIDGFFSLCEDGCSMSNELPNYMDHERCLADNISILEEDFIALNGKKTEKTGEEHLSLSNIEEQKQAWNDHCYGSFDPDDMYQDDAFENEGDD